jgi:ferritin-like metal-binding protein YciE
MSKIKNLEELLVDELKDLYSAETQLIKALPKMAEAATSPELKQAFEGHLLQTRGHAERLVQALGLLGESEGGKTCHAMKGLIDEGSEAIKADAPDAVRDADLIGAAQRVEHYEIAGYTSAISSQGSWSKSCRENSLNNVERRSGYRTLSLPNSTSQRLPRQKGAKNRRPLALRKSR